MRMMSIHRSLCRLCGGTIPKTIQTRWLYSTTGAWDKKFTKGVRQELENYWKPKLNKYQRPETTGGKEKYYVLSMFPYPSGKLHMGHVRVYTISDVMARYHRLNGKTVIHPMGWDAFGLPAENAAIERGLKPDEWTYRNIVAMKEQIEHLCLSFDWDTEFATCDSSYYKWTQYLFLKMMDAGLVYQKEGAVNWDPVDQTVLADEQIDEQGCSWRSGATAEKRFLRQWYIKATAYTKSLVEGLSEVKSDLWQDIIELQRHWIGTCDGVRLEFRLKYDGEMMNDSLSIFTQHPECIYGASHVLVSPKHFLCSSKYIKEDSIDKHHLQELNTVAFHPLTGQSLPMFISHEWNFGELDCHLAIPDCCDIAKSSAQHKNLSYLSVLDEHKVKLTNSEEFSGMSLTDAFEAVTQKAKLLKCGGDMTSVKARDWLISRQRYWGTPIPIVHCPRYGAVPVAYEDLPVILPKVTTLTGKGDSPLAAQEDWVKVKCARCDCDSFGLRETDTMDTFVDSSWYFLRYLDSENNTEPFSPAKVASLMPVDLYIGGKEHATMHLYYARFFNHFLHSLGLVPQKEPFVNLLTQGMVMGRSFQVIDTGKYLTHDEVDFSGEEPRESGTGAELTVRWEKMSKSKHNGVDPQDVLDEFGCDATRLCILSNVAPKSDRHWSHDVFQGVINWQSRIWSLVSEICSLRDSGCVTAKESDDLEKWDKEIWETRNHFVKEVEFHMKTTFLLNTAVSRLQGLTNVLKKVPPSVLASSSRCEHALADLIIMLAPFAPMFATELWEGLRNVETHMTTEFLWDKPVWSQQWPTLDPNYRLPMNVKIDKMKALRVHLPDKVEHLASFSKEAALSLAKEELDLDTLLGGNPISSYGLSVDPGVRVELRISTQKSKKKQKKSKLSAKPGCEAVREETSL